MSRLGIKYDECRTVADSLKMISNCNYSDLINDLQDVLRTVEELTYKPDTAGVSSSISKAKENKQKIINFANALDSYAESLYNFDNEFYNNFVMLDGTNSKNYDANIRSLNISDDEIESMLLSDENSLESLIYELNKAINRDLGLGKDSTIKAIRDKLRDFVLSDENPKALKYLLKGNSFKVIRDKVTKDVFVQLRKSDLDTSDLKQCAKFMHDKLNALSDRQLANILSGKDTKNIRKLERFVDRAFSEDGLRIYDKSSGKLSSYANKLLKGDFGDLNKFIKDSKLSEPEYFWKNIKKAAKEDLFGEAKYIKDNVGKAVKSAKAGDMLDDVKNIKLKGSSLLEFGGKAFGAYDKIDTICTNAKDDHIFENGKLNLSNGENNKKFVVDTTVDLTTSAGAAAAGALIGSAVPGVGTVVGAAAGATISVVINHKFGDPPKSAVDHVKDWANDGVDFVGKEVGKIFW